MNAFSQQIVASGVDVRVILLGDRDAICIGAPLGSGQCPNDTKLPNYIHVPVEVGSNDALNIFIDSYPDWRQYPRPEATKSFVVVTDDDATYSPNNSAATFQASVAALESSLARRPVPRFRPAARNRKSTCSSDVRASPHRPSSSVELRVPKKLTRAR